MVRFTPPLAEAGKAPWLSLLLGVLHAMAGLAILVVSAWFIAACAMASVSFNYMLPAVVIRALALLRIGSGYAHMWAGHHDLLQRTAELRHRLFRKLADSRINNSTQLADALANHTETLASVWIASVSPLLNALLLLPVLWLVSMTMALPGSVAIGVLSLGWLALSVYLVWRSLVLSSRLVATEQDWLAGSTGYFRSASLWHLYTFAQHQKVSMQPIWELQDRLHALASQGNWLLQGMALILVALVIGFADTPVLSNPLAICVPMVLLAVPDWLGKTSPAATFQTRFSQARHALQSLPVEPVPVVSGASTHPVTVSLTRFCARGRLCPPVTDTLPPTGVVIVSGPSGAGKSSLLQALAGELSWQGSKTAEGCPLPAGLLSGWYYVDQQARLLQGTLQENLNPAGMTTDKAKISELLHRLGLGYLTMREWLGAGGRELSGGERKRIALGRALLHRPQTLLLDEPFEGLDRFSVNAVVSLINTYATTSRVIIATHCLPEYLTVTKTIMLEASAGETRTAI